MAIILTRLGLQVRRCDYCGEPFFVRDWDARRRPATFCSPRCRNKSRTKPPEARGQTKVRCVCVQCGEFFRTTSSELRRGHGSYCSRRCASKALASLSFESRFWSKVRRTDACWLWTGANLGGKWPYGILGRNGYTPLKAHHVSWEIHNGEEVPKGLWVLHNCDNPQCVRPDHLFLGTAADNTADMMRKGRARGGRPIGTKLSPESLSSFRAKRGFVSK